MSIYYQDDAVEAAARARRRTTRRRAGAPMTDHCPACPFRGCETCRYQGGSNGA